MNRHTTQNAPPEGVVINGMLGYSAQREVFLGFAAANVLHALSFADVLDEDTNRGYQRRFNAQHSLDFRRYIQLETSSTIPLTFNLRPREDEAWRILRDAGKHARLVMARDRGKLLTQVDCQHRLGHLNDLALQLPFMCYVGLSEREEMAIFNVINSKAKGLSTSLLDFHDSRLSEDLAGDRPELFIALHLRNNSESPWYRQLDLGGSTTSGMSRRASLRTMQKATRRFLSQTKVLRSRPPEVVAQMILDFWAAIAVLLQDAWNSPRRYLLCKGVGVYALMGIAGDLVNENNDSTCDKRYFINKLSEFIGEIDWTSTGKLAGLGGETGAKSALALLRSVRCKSTLKVVNG